MQNKFIMSILMLMAVLLISLSMSSYIMSEGFETLYENTTSKKEDKLDEKSLE